MKILICGDRHWSDRKTIRSFIRTLASDTTVIHGAANGADSIAGEEAILAGLKVISVPAKWAQYGRAAGVIRNRVMLSMNPDLVVAFHNHIEASKGTKDCITEANRRGIPTEVKITGRCSK